MRIFLIVMIFVLTAIFAAAAIEWVPHAVYFPRAILQVSDGLEIVVAQGGKLDRARCEQDAGQLARLARANCPACKVAASCARGLDETHRALLSRDPLPMPSARRADNALTIAFNSADAAVAAEVCRQSAAATTKAPEQVRLTCYPAGAAR